MKFKLVLISLAIGTGISGSEAYASLLQNGGFETPIVPPTPSPDHDGAIDLTSGEMIGPWSQLSGGTETLVLGRWFGALPFEGKQHVAFNAGDRTPGGALQQSFSTVPGSDYSVTFAVGRGGSGGGQLGLRAEIFSGGGSLLQTLDAPAPDALEYWSYSMQFTATTATSAIRFSDISVATTSVDVMLDDVAVTGASPVNDSASMPAMMAITVVASGLFRRARAMARAMGSRLNC